MGEGEKEPESKDASSSAPTAAADKKKVEDPQVKQNMLMGALVLIVVAAVIEQVGGLDVAKAQIWANSLFEEHVVPPPKANKDQVVIQFCQS